MEHFDVLIVGAGLSGIGAAHFLTEEHPQRSFVILEARERMGGTWDLFRYPGIRSDSDMHTLGYRFRPWIDEKAIADGPTILDYIHDTARDGGIDEHIRYQHRVVAAEWSTDESRWTATIERGDTGETVRVTASFMYMCTGYYSYESPYQPEFPGQDRFQGLLIHPQFWSPDIDYGGKRVVVVGSGATAITLVPAMTDKAAHVTMLQRSPSYVASLPARDWLANTLRRILPDKIAYAITRVKNIARQQGFYQLSRSRPKLVRALIKRMQQRELPADFDIDKHFTPRYNPWDERFCLVPDADLFAAIREGKASIVTDRIKTFTETGIELESGETLEADVIITATGLSLLMLGGMRLRVDREDVDVSERFMYRGMMLEGVPNAAAALGYTNASWTLKADITSDYVCQLLAHMDKHGYAKVVAVNEDPTMKEEPALNLKSGYIERGKHLLPKAGDRGPWRMLHNYSYDRWALARAGFDDPALRFSRARQHDLGEDRAMVGAR